MQNPMIQCFSFPALPLDAEALMRLPEASLDSPFKTTALAMLALLRYETDPESCFAMLNALRGPDPLSPYGKSFIRDRLRGKSYKIRSFFKGATPQNNYTAMVPYQIQVQAAPSSFDSENWATLYVQSAGADSARPIRLRRKPSTNQWFINEIQCLSDIRLPVEADPWA